MGKRLLKLPRRLFGYQASSVDQLIADRDSMLGLAEQRVRSAEARIAELQEELSRRDEDMEAVKARIEAADDPAPATPPAAFQEGVEDDEPERASASPWISAEPAVPSPPIAAAATDDDDDDDADEVEEWPLPTVRPRTVEFIPPPEPSADFDPMPIGGEDHDWSSPSVDRWGAGSEQPVTEAESAWGALADEAAEHASASAEAATWRPEDEGTTDEPPAHVDPWSSVQQAQDEPPAEPAVPQLTPAYMSEELAHVVKAAEESATKIIERAWESTRTQIEQVDRLWREVQEEIIRFAAWRQHVDPMIATVQGYIEQARSSIEQVPERIQEALSPAVEAMARVDTGMSEFARASDLPQLLGKLHAEVARIADTGDFSSESTAGDQEFDPPTEVPEEVELEANHPTSTNGGPRAHQDEGMDMVRAIGLRVIAESGDPITSPDAT